MDGFKAQITHSLQLKLSLWLSVTILLIAIVAGGFSFVSAFQEANELQDDQLRQVASFINRNHLNIAPKGPQSRVPGTDPDSLVIVQVLQKSSPMTANMERNVLNLPPSLQDGMQTVTIQSEPWRLFIKTLSSGTRIAVGQQTAIRDETARDSALRTLMPLVILVPILLLLVSDLVRKMFKPLKLLANELDHKTDQELFEVRDETLPDEIKPFVTAINRLLKRVSDAVMAQRRFVADAAHELRSPLTALALQIERLAHSDMSAEAHERLNTVKTGLERSRQLLEQLLVLARTQLDNASVPETVLIQPLFRELLEDLYPLAEAKGIDIGVISTEEVALVTQRRELQMLLKNLIDNAIRYTPANGQIDLNVQKNSESILITVQDNGPGIPLDERERVFDPFYRLLGSDEVGSGLGLSIVKNIAHQLGARITLENAQTSGRGLLVRVWFPAPTAIIHSQ